MGGYSTISYEMDGTLLLLCLNRPEHLNAFTVEMADELEDAYASASRDDGIKAIVVTGTGRAFCAGMDLSEVDGNVFGLDETLRPTLSDLQERPLPNSLERGVRDTGGRVALAMFDCLKPIIGAINGAAVGIGATMTLPMDVRLASTDAKIGFVFGHIGITPDACSTWFLPRVVGLERALELFYRAEILSADEALQLGLFRSLHDPNSLVQDACDLARSLVSNRSPVSLALMRQMTLRNSAQTHPRAAHDVESLAMFYTSMGDGKEGVRAFREKRSPNFTAAASIMPSFYPW